MKTRNELKFEGNKKYGSPLWNAYTNPITGESTYQEITPREVIPPHDHYYEYIDRNGNFQCKNCPAGGRLIPAYNQIREGKIIKIASKQRSRL